MKTTSKTKITIALILSLNALSANLFAAPDAFDPFGKTASPTAQNKIAPNIPQVDFSNNEIAMALQIISDATGWSIFTTPATSTARISLWAKDIPADQLLDKIVNSAGFTYHRNKNIITIMTWDEYTQHHGLERKVIPLEFAIPSAVQNTIMPFLSRMGKCTVHQQTNTLIIYDTPANLSFLETIIESIDTPAENKIIDIIELKYADAEIIANKLQKFFNPDNSGKTNSTKNPTTTNNTSTDEISTPQSDVLIQAISQTNHLIIRAGKNDLKTIKNFITKLDIPSENENIDLIELKYADSENVAEKLQKIFNPENSNQTPLQKQDSANNTSPNEISTPQSEVLIQALGRTNRLIIRARKNDLKTIKDFVVKLDIFSKPITKNYQLVYANAEDVFASLEQTLNLENSSSSNNSKDKKYTGITLIQNTNSIVLTASPAAHRITSSIIEQVDKPGTYETSLIRIYKIENADVDEVAKTVSEIVSDNNEEQTSSTTSKFNNTAANASSTAPETSATDQLFTQIKTTVSISKSTNSIIVQTTSRQHREIEKLIEELDKRRRQVLIEAMIVEISTTDNLNFGIELGHASTNPAKEVVVVVSP